MNNHICGDPNSACDAECMERAHRAELRTSEERDAQVTTLPADQQVWLTAWCAVASCWNTKEQRVCSKWADACLEDFRARFRK